MTPEQFQRVHALLDAIRDVAPTDRDTWLTAHCDDQEVRAEVRALLVHDDQPHAMLDEPLFDLGAALGAGPVPPPSSPATSARASSPPSAAFFTNDPATAGPDATSPTSSFRAGHLAFAVLLGLVLVAGALLVRLVLTATTRGPETGERNVAPLDTQDPATDEPAPDLSSVAAALAARDVGRAQALLRQVPAAARAWEWDALAHRADRSLGVVGTHAADIVTVAWHPDARRLATADAPGTVHVWDTESRAPVWTLAPPDDAPVRALAFSRFGATLTVVERTAVRTFSATTGTPIDETPAASPITVAAWDRAAEHLATADEAGEIIIRAADDDDTDSRRLAIDAKVRALALSAGGALLAAASDDELLAWRTHDERPLGPWPLASVRTLAFDPASDRLVAGTEDGALAWIDVETSVVDRWHTGDAAITAIAFDATGDRLAVAAADHTVTLWSGPRPTRVATLATGPHVVRALASGGDRLATAAADGTVRLWPWSAVDMIETEASPVTSVRVRDGVVLAVIASNAGTIARAHDLTDGRRRHASTHSTSITAMDIFADGIVFAADGAVHWTNAMTDDDDNGDADPSPAPISIGAPISDLVVIPDRRQVVLALGSRLAVVGFDGVPPRFVDVPATDVAADARGRRIATLDAEITVLRASTLETVRTWPVPADAHRRSIAFTPDGRLLVATDETLTLLDVDTGEATELRLPRDRRGAPVVLRDGARIAVVDGDGAVRVLDVRTGTTTVTLPIGATRATGVIGCDANGETLVIALDDGTLRVWTGSKPAP